VGLPGFVPLCRGLVVCRLVERGFALEGLLTHSIRKSIRAADFDERTAAHYYSPLSHYSMVYLKLVQYSHRCSSPNSNVNAGF